MQDTLKICEFHTDFAAQVSEMAADIKWIKERVATHIEEGEKPVTGFRDRVLILEREVSSLKKAMWARVSVAGFIGGLVSQLTPEAFQFIVKLIAG